MTAASPGAAELWLDAHGDALFAFARLRVGDPDVAEDLVQETLLGALGAVAGFAGHASERTWLTGILKHKIVDHLRKSGREIQLTDDAVDALEDDARFDHTGHWTRAPSDWGDPARIAENEALGRVIQRCIERLPERQQRLFVLREIDGLASDELIDLLGLSSANNLWVTLARARERLRTCVEQNGFGRTTA